MRAQLWLATLAPLGSADLRRELHEAASGLAAQAVAPDTAAVQTQRLLVDGLTRLSRANPDDEALMDLLSRGATPHECLASVAKWAGTLAFSEAPTGDTTVAAPPVHPRGVQPVRVKSTAATLADGWVLKLRLPNEGPLERHRLAVVSAAEALAREASSLGSVEGLMAFDAKVEEVALRSKEWRDAVGDLTPLQEDLREAEEAVSALEEWIGDSAAARLIQEHYITPNDGLAIAALLKDPMLAHAPEWLVPSAQQGDGVEDTRLRQAVLFADRETRGLVRLFCDFSAELQEPAATGWLAAPEPGDSVERHLRDWFERVRDFLVDLPAELRAALVGPHTDFGIAQTQASGLALLRSDLPTEVFQDLQRDVLEAPPSDRPRLLAACVSAVRFLKDALGLEAVSAATVRARMARELEAAGRGTQETPPAPTIGLSSITTVEHNYLEGRTARATLLFTRSEGGEDYGTVSLPIVIETEQPSAVSVALRWNVKGDARIGWSRDWPNPEPDDETPTQIPFYAWRRQPDGRHWHFSLVGRLPIRTPKASHPRLEVEFTVLDAQTESPLGPSRVLRWEAIQLTPAPLSVVWGDATEPSHVREHPIGPQERASTIQARFGAGSSVAVIAPRRFGKSTLVEYLVREGRKHKLLIPQALVCTKYASVSGFDYDAFWEDLSRRLVDAVGVRLKRESVGALPAASAFDDVRVAARKKGHKAVIVLLDEAQLFFSGQRGELGSQLKTLVERDLARTDDKKKAPVLFGLIGLPSLHERAGADLLGVLNPIEKSIMEESELRPLISKMTTGLQTTRGARQKLAETAGNLLILRALLEKLATRATRERRVWVNYDDVVAVEESLKKDLQEGREVTVASYIRDVLNAADRVDDWRPISSLPAAAAWARTYTPGRPESESADRAVELLNQWCGLSQGNEPHGVRPVYTAQILARHLQQLRERRVLNGAEFISPLLQAWLSGLATRSTFDDAFRDALFSGAQRRIRLPSGADRVSEGAQAAVWRSGEFAYRVRQLSGQAERDQFLEGAEMLEVLRQIVQGREVGSDHIFELVDIGLSERDEHEAIQVYRWVEGQTLTLREGGLAGDVVVDIGVKLARGLRLLHRSNVLHRDICPRNVVLDDVTDPLRLRPVLIDFGFARLAGSAMHTAMAGEHIAPEVRGPRPEWSRAADVYALGSTLTALLDPRDEATPLREILEQATAEKGEARPTTEFLLETLEQLERSYDLEGHREEAWRRLRAAIEQDRAVPWLSEQMNKMRESLILVSLGFYRIPLQRYGEIAVFLGRLAESAPATRSSLSGLGLREEDEALKVIGALRNERVHGRGNQTDDQRVLIQKLQRSKPTEQKRYVQQCAQALSGLCGLESLPILVNELIG